LALRLLLALVVEADTTVVAALEQAVILKQTLL
jgi:hypothetical protein